MLMESIAGGDQQRLIYSHFGDSLCWCTTEMPVMMPTFSIEVKSRFLSHVCKNTRT